MFMPFIDPLWIVFAIPGLLVMLYAQIKVKSAFGKYSQVRNMPNATGAQIGRRLLDGAGLRGVAIEMVQGDLTDHYDPRSKVLRLSPQVYSVPSVAAMGIVAHEVGHAIQDSEGYVPLRVRGSLVPVVNIGSWLGYIFFFLGFIAQFSGLVWLGILFFSGAVAFSLVTLPVEFNASRRAMQLLQANGLVGQVEVQGVQSVLNAAALTYVAALLQAVGQLMYWVVLALGMRRDE